MIQLNYCSVIEERKDGNQDAKRGIEIEI